MSGAVFSAKGASTGQAPQTVWMSPLADTMTAFSNFTEAPTQGFYAQLVAPYNVPPTRAGLQVPYHCSVGASSTAPDGTSTAQHITEDSSNGNHYIGCAFSAIPLQSPYWRIAGIYKAAERTRICFELTDLAFGQARVGFDLAGGQIAYGPTDSPSNGLFNKGAQILPVVGFSGWYLCIFDLTTNSPFNPLFLRTYLDNGSGTGARSVSYAGDGTSGVIGWKTSVLPIQAWRIGSTALLNNFANSNDLNRIDINNTKLPGFDFYFQPESWTNWQGVTPSTPGNSPLVSGVPSPGTLAIVADGASPDGFSLHFPSGPKANPNDTTSHYQWSMGFATETAPGRAGSATPLAGTFAGRGFVPPYLLEWSYRFQVSSQAADGSDNDIWGTALECQATIASANPNKYLTGGDISLAESIPYKNTEANFQMGSEVQWQDFGSPGYEAAPGAQTAATTVPHLGCFPFYLSNISLHNSGQGGGPYESSGSYYTNLNGVGSTVSGPPGNPPWVPYVYGTDHIAGNDQPPVKIDLQNVFQKMSRLFLPYDPVTGAPGCCLAFHNGNCRGYNVDPWTPAALSNTNPYYHVNDWQQRNWWWNPGSVTGSGYDFNFDYIKVMQ